MKYKTNPTKKLSLQKTSYLITKYKLCSLVFIATIFFNVSISAQDNTPPVLISSAASCSSLDQLNLPECFAAGTSFDGKSFESSVAALYTDDSPPVTATLINTILNAPGNAHCSWMYTYTYRIQDIFENSVECQVKRSGSDPQLPTFTVPANITIYQTSICEFGELNPEPSVSGDVTDAADNCGILEIIYADCEGRRGAMTTEEGCSFACLGTKVIERTWRVYDSCGNEASGIQIITIIDLIPPEFTACPQNFAAPNCNNVTWDVAATDNCSNPVNLSYEFSGATTGSGSGTGSGNAFLTGVTLVTITATDDCGNSSVCQFEVTATCSSIEIAISAEITRTIYTGTFAGAGPFGPQSINLCAVVSGGTPTYTYSWTPTTSLNLANIPNPVASPTVSTIYTLTVTDFYGNSGSLNFPVNVLPLSSAVCTGNGNNVKFKVCHVPPGNPGNPHNICIDGSGVPAHLAPSYGHNTCYLGPCGQQLCYSTSAGGCQLGCFVQKPSKEVITSEIGRPDDEFSIQVYPNPSNSDFTIQVFSKSNEQIKVRILDNNGVVRTDVTSVLKSNFIKIGSNLTRGTYIAEVIQGNNRKVVKLVKLN